MKICVGTTVRVILTPNQTKPMLGSVPQLFKMSTWAVSSEEDVEDFNCNACLQIF